MIRAAGQGPGQVREASSEESFKTTSSTLRALRSLVSHTIGEANWCIRNYLHQRTPSFSATTSITEDIKDLPSWEVVKKIQMFISKTSEESPIDEVSVESKYLVYKLIEKLLKYLGFNLTPAELFEQKLEQGLALGCCYGTSMTVLKALVRRDNLDDAVQDIKQLSKEDVVLFQILEELRAEIVMIQHYRDGYLRNLQNIPDDKYSEMLADEVSNKVLLFAKYKEGNQLLQEIDRCITDLAGFSLEKKDEFSNGTPEGKEAMRNFLVENQGSLFEIGIFANDSNEVGHSVVLDLKNNGFWDAESGYYQYPNLEACLDAFFERIDSVYAEYHNSTWKFNAVIV